MARRLFLAVLPLALAGCSLRMMAVRSTADILERGLPAYYEESDTELAREGLASNLKLVEVLLKNDPRNQRLLLAAAQGFCGYAFLFLEDEEPQRASRLYARGRDYGRRLLRRRKLSELMLGAKRKDVPALFWTAQCWASWVNLNKQDPEAIADLPTAVEMAEAVRKLDPAYWYGAADAFLGVYHAGRPRILGGNPAIARAHFEAAVGAYPDFLMNRVLFAQYYSVAVQDREHFRQTLQAVVEAPLRMPEQELTNRVAKEKAEFLIGRIDDLF